MNVKIDSSWKQALDKEFEKPYFKNLTQFVRKEYVQQTCYPKGNEIFAAFDHCPLDRVKVVIIGQDPYHNPKQANGLCFSVRDGIPHPPSLVNIFKEAQSDVGKPYPNSGNLEHWAEQGVLLLNAVLTVRAHQPGSHQNKGWEQFTDAAIQALSQRRNKLVFLLWGGFAKRKAAVIHKNDHHLLFSGHPSPLSANRGLWFGNKHFSRCNEFLEKTGQHPIRW